MSRRENGLGRHRGGRKMQVLTDELQKGLQKNSTKPAVSFFKGADRKTRLTFCDLDRDANRLANFLAAHGVGGGDRVVLLLDKSLLFVTAHLAVQKIGAVTVPLNPGYKSAELQYFLKDAEPILALVNRSKASVIADIDPRLAVIAVDDDHRYEDIHFFNTAADTPPPVDIRPEDPSLIIYTSGTTGDPKGAVLTQRNLMHNARLIIDGWAISENDVLCHALPLFHVHGLCFALHTCLLTGAHILMLDRFDPETVVRVLRQTRKDFTCSLFMAVPAMYNRLMDVVGRKRTHAFDHVRLWASGSAPLLAKDFTQLTAVFGKEPLEREGMTETGMNFSNPLQGKRKPGSIGLALPDLAVRIVDPDTSADVAPGETGEFWLKSPSIFPGYWKKPVETAAAFEDGWFKTGDLGRRDADGYYFLTDRLKNIIISGGENVSPAEIEAVINQVDGVVESCVVGIPDPQWGEKIVAAVVGKPQAGDIRRQIQNACRRDLHNWKCPKEILLMERLPKNTMGKIRRDAVHSRFDTAG